MGSHINSIKNHMIFSSFEKVFENLDSLKKDLELPADHIAAIMDIEYVLTSFKENLEYADANLISTEWLDYVNHAITGISTRLTQYQSNNNYIYITTSIASHLNTVREYMSKICVIKGKPNLQGAAGTANKLQKTVEGYLKRAETASAEVANFKQESDAVIRESVDRTVAVIEENKKKFDDYRKQAEDLLGAISTGALAREYEEFANSASKLAKKWRIATLVSIVAIIALAVVCVILLNKVNVDLWADLPLVLSVAFLKFSIAALGVYSAKQASERDERAMYARRIHMEMKSLNPFIASVEDEGVKEEIKKEVALKIFGNSHSMIGGSAGEQLSFNDMLRLLEIAVCKK